MMKSWHAVALLSVVVLAAYYPVLFAPLNRVDDLRMANDLLNRTGFSFHDFFVPTSKSYFRPLINSSFIVGLFLWKLEASFLHLENLLLHLSNTILVYLLLRQLTRQLKLTGVLIPFLAALLFGVHPLNTEAVIWIAGRADLLACFFVLLTLKFSISFIESYNRAYLALIALTFLLGCFAKETALFVWPGLILLGWTLRENRGVSLKGLRTFLPAVSCCFSILIYFLLRSIALKGRDLGAHHAGDVLAKSLSGGEEGAVTLTKVSYSISDKLEHALTVSGFYLKKVLQPFPLNFGIVEVDAGYFWLGLLLVILCIYLLARLSLAACLGLTAVSLGSIALLVAFGEISWTPVAERYMYAPMATATLGVGLAAGRFIQMRNPGGKTIVLAGLCLFVSAGFAYAVFDRAITWQDNVALFEDTVAKSPNFQMAKNELALALLTRGDIAEAKVMLRNLDISELQVSSLNKVEIWIDDGEYSRARGYLLERLQNPGAYHRVVLDKLVKLMEAMMRHTSSASLFTDYQLEQLSYLEKLWVLTREPFYLYRIGRVQMTMGDTHSAQKSFAEAHRLFPETSLYKEPALKLSEKLGSQ